ncbi:MAG: PIG-L family deacetylase, partial [Planctomycetes bacterium]|nr:PIG-L family deacetylase [Planctomycetota bacterium]
MTRYLAPPAPPIRSSAPPARGRVLVLAPHPDDETIGPGGTVRLHVELGDEVHALFLTAGTSGDPTGREDKVAYASRRQDEARAAARVLGIAAQEFWGFPDNYRVNELDLGAILPRLKQAIEAFAPDVIYAP